jgi:hypothetical protein
MNTEGYDKLQKTNGENKSPYVQIARDPETGVEENLFPEQTRNESDSKVANPLEVDIGRRIR